MSELFPGYLRVTEAAARLGLHDRTVRSLIAGGRLPAEKRFNVLFVAEDDVLRLAIQRRLAAWA